MAEKAFELSQKAMDEVAELRGQLRDCVDAENDCRKRFAECAELTERLGRQIEDNREHIAHLQSQVGGLKSLIEDRVLKALPPPT